MNYAATLHFLYQQLPMYSRIGAAAYKKDLTNIQALCHALDQPQKKFKSIHIAGTNGKGSTSHMLAAILQEAGYTTGLYTSPHLTDFRERIRINGEMITEDFAVTFVERIRQHINVIQPSFFELTVAMAFEYFAQQQVDIAVIEVGLGGRLDSTNIIDPILSVITHIGYDHVQMLGNSLPEIAFEKAGIIKLNTPVVIGEVLPETRPVFEKQATTTNAPISFAQEKRYIADWKYEHHRLVVDVEDYHSNERKKYHLDLTGIYQTKNVLTVLEAAYQLRIQNFKLDDTIIAKALSQVKKTTGLHGRWEVIHQHPTVILDVAHNEDGMKQIVEQLELTNYDHLHIIIGMVKDKAIEKVLSLLPKTAAYYFTKAQIPRALPEKELAEIASVIGLQGYSFMDVNTAIQIALQHAQPKDLILVCGSVFLVGEVKRI